MRVFIDLGAAKGDTLAIALKRCRDFDRFYAFEPLKSNFAVLEKKFGGNSNVSLINAAAATATGQDRLYLGDGWGDAGGSLVRGKTTSFQDKWETVELMDFSRFLLDNFAPGDRITLKINVEGKEYDLLHEMMENGTIKRIDRIYCEWHYDRIGIAFAEHVGLIMRLRRLGFALAGSNQVDEFGRVMNANRTGWLLRKCRWDIYYWSKEHPGPFSLLKKVSRLWRGKSRMPGKRNEPVPPPGA